MKLRTVLMCAVIASASLSFAGEMPWAKNFKEAETLAKKSGKLIMIDFYTDWCGWCKTLDKNTYSDLKVQEQAKAYVPVKINAEKEGKDLAKKYVVNGYPTILFLDTKGTVCGRIGGYMPPESFMPTVKGILEAQKEIPAIEKALAKNPKDGKLNAKLACMLALRGDTAGSEAALNLAEKANYRGPEMPKAFNAVGDAYQTAGLFDKAIGFFTKADASATDPAQKSYAVSSIAYCYLSKGDKVNAIKYAKDAMAIPGASADDVKNCKQLIDQLSKG